MKLSTKEKVLLFDVLVLHLQQMKDTGDQMEQDPTFKSLDEYMETMGQAHDDFNVLSDIMERIGYDLAQPRVTSGIVRTLYEGVQSHAQRGYGVARSRWGSRL